MRGNFGRAGTLIDAISKGQRPPTPDVVDTPRGGLDLTHRVALLFAGTPAPSAAWSSVTPHPRGTAEPWLDAWLSQTLPDPATVLCAVRYHDAAGDHEASVALRDLDLGPLDVLALADTSDTPQKGELEARILYTATASAAVPAGATDLQINFAPASMGPDSLSFPDFFFLARSLRSLVSAGRPLSPQDLTVPEVNAANAGGAVDMGDLRNRVGAAVTALGNDLAALNTAAAGLPGAPDPVRTALLQCSFCGVVGSIPLTASGPDPNLAVQAASVAKILQTRQTQASAVVLASASVADLLALPKTIFGTDFTVLPRFTPPDFASLQTAFAQSSNLVASDRHAPARWIAQLSHLRPGISRLDVTGLDTRHLVG